MLFQPIIPDVVSQYSAISKISRFAFFFFYNLFSEISANNQLIFQKSSTLKIIKYWN